MHLHLECRCVIFSEVIEHLNKSSKAISEIRRILKKGGLFIILFPNNSLFMIIRLLMLMIKEAFYDTGHRKQWTPKQIRELLIKNNFQVNMHKNLPFIFWPISLHHLVVAKKL